MTVKILVVDDSTTDRLIIKNMLSGYCVYTACDGMEAIRIIDSIPEIDLIILDLNMPNMDGFQVLEVLNFDDQYKNIRTIILTNHDEIDNEVKGLKMGAVDYIRKPIHMDSLRVRIEIHFELLYMQRFVEHELYEKELTFNAIFQQAPMGVAIYQDNDNVGEYFMVNPKYEAIVGRKIDELSKIGWMEITHPDDREKELEKYNKLRLGEIQSYHMEKRYIWPDGSVIWVYVLVTPIEVEKNIRYISLVQDITERKEAEKALAESERSKSVFLSHLPGLAYRCDFDYEGTMRYISEGCYDLTGYAPESFLNNRDLAFNDLIEPEGRALLWQELNRTVPNKLPYRCEYQIRTANGEQKWVLETGQGVYNEHGDFDALEGIVIDISDKKEIENDLIYKSHHDIWTGLLNRSCLENILTQDAKIPLTENRAIVNVNLSSIHLLSLTYGFHYSQTLLKKVAGSLQGYCDNNHKLFSTYEYRFAFYVKGYKDKNALNAFCQAIAVTLESTLMAERIGGGIGVIEISESNKHDVELLLKNLLVTSEKAIKTYKSDIGICFFDKEMEVQIVCDEAISRELSQIAAGENVDRLFLLYQPIFDLKTNQIYGFEALARLSSDDPVLVPPLKFIPIAERTKLIVPVGEIILRKALYFLQKVEEEGYDTINMSINISAIQLLREGFIETLVDVIREYKIAPERICLEFTESIFFSDFENINSVLSEVKRYGIKVALDDFGTGYSSFAREQELNIDCLKIDKSFIDKLMEVEAAESITGDIISMAHKIGHYVVAEGVEHEKQLQYLKDHDCDKVQGYLIGKPLSEDDTLELLKKNKNTI